MATNVEIPRRPREDPVSNVLKWILLVVANCEPRRSPVRGFTRLPGKAREGVEKILSFLRRDGFDGQSWHTALGTMVIRSDRGVGADEPAYRFPTCAGVYLRPHRRAHNLRRNYAFDYFGHRALIGSLALI